MSIATRMTQLIGKTPLLQPKRWLSLSGHETAQAFVKLEFLNPTGSVKDRAALGMLEALEASGQLQAGGTLVEPTSGNTGIALAALAATKGYKVILTMPETMSVERRNLLRAYGATLVLTPGAEGMKGAIAKAKEILAQTPGAVMPDQFSNEANAAYHFKTTGPELWADLDGQIDVLIAGVGTGGSLTGAGRYLRSRNPALEIVAVEPASSAVLSGEGPGKHGIQGIGAGFIPALLDTNLISRVAKVTEAAAYAEARTFARSEGILLGISSGAALAVLKDALQQDPNKRYAVILPDSGDRYLSTPLYQFEEEGHA